MSCYNTPTKSKLHGHVHQSSSISKHHIHSHNHNHNHIQHAPLNQLSSKGAPAHTHTHHITTTTSNSNRGSNMQYNPHYLSHGHRNFSQAHYERLIKGKYLYTCMHASMYVCMYVCMYARSYLQSKVLPTELRRYFGFSFHQLHNWSNALHLLLYSFIGKFNKQSKLS